MYNSDNNDLNGGQAYNGAYSVENANAFFARIFLWMFGGLSVTGIIAMITASNETMLYGLMTNMFLFLGIIIFELILVSVISRKALSLPFQASVFLFFLYSFLNGLTLSTIFVVYTAGSIVSAFFTASAVFAVMGLYGFFSKKDLSGIGAFLRMSIWGSLFALLINIVFIKSEAFDLLISIVVVLIFSGLTAFHIQNFKNNYSNIQDGETLNRVSVACALVLYLDFINIFIYLLRIFGKRR